MAYNDTRVFRADTPRAALMAVKAELGDDAVILSTRQVGVGLLRRQQIEVTATAGRPAAKPVAVGHAPASASPASELEQEVTALRRAVEDMGRGLHRALADGRARSATLGIESPIAARLARRLIGRGVEESMADEIAARAEQQAEDAGPEALADAVLTEVRKRLLPGRAPWSLESKGAIALIGPTGAGKTTTLAKIAARALLDAGRKVSLITVDTYRIGAADQIARYGEIMGIPSFVARDKVALRDCFAKCAQADLVLVDTAGRVDADGIAQQAALVRGIPEIELHLVLPATSGAREIAAAARRYKPLSPTRLIFSKLDEADGPGSILSAAAELGRPISCVADGQRVPEDLHNLTGPALARLVVGS